MPCTISQEPSSNDMEKLFLQDILPIIPTVVGQAYASLGHHPDQTEVNNFAQRIGFLLWENDYRVLRSFKHESSPETWLFTITKRHIRLWLREQDGIESLDDMPPDSFTVQPSCEERLLSKEREEILQAAVSKLTKREQKLLGLWRQERSREEIAEEMGIKRKSVSVEKVDLIKKLQRIIREDYAI